MAITCLCVCVCVCIPLCTTLVHDAAQNNSDNLPSYAPNNHHISDIACRTGGKADEGSPFEMSDVPAYKVALVENWSNSGQMQFLTPPVTRTGWPKK